MYNGHIRLYPGWRLTVHYGRVHDTVFMILRIDTKHGGRVSYYNYIYVL